MLLHMLQQTHTAAAATALLLLKHMGNARAQLPQCAAPRTPVMPAVSGLTSRGCDHLPWPPSLIPRMRVVICQAGEMSHPPNR